MEQMISFQFDQGRSH